MQRSVKGALIATAVAGLFMAHAALAGETAGGNDSEVKCMGVNECKGKGGCGVQGKHECAGENECKGKGWIKLSKEDCQKKGGTVLQ